MVDEHFTCSVEEFITHYMPFAPAEQHVEQLISRRAGQSGTLPALLEEFRQKFVYKEPRSICDQTERTIHEDLACIAQMVDTFDAPRTERTRNDLNYFLFHVGNTQDYTEDQINQVDACFRSGQGALDISDIAVFIEQKCSFLDEQEGYGQTRSMNARIMNKDARRMFIFSIEIVVNKLYLWYHSRSHSAVSIPFDFIKEPCRLIQVFMALMYATREELGYDHMVTRCLNGGYTYEIPSEHGSRFFRTTKALASSFPQSTIAGHTTRVWSVTEVDRAGCAFGGRSNFVLKDVCILGNARTEREIQEELFSDIEAFFKSNDQTIHADLQSLRRTHAEIVENGRYKSYFLTIAADHVGQSSRPMAPRTENTLDNENLQISRASTDSPRPFDSSISEGRQYTCKPRKQYRVVFEEECTALRDVATLGEMVDAIASALTPLELLLGAGWVHRDISCGNLLIQYCEHGSQIKLADLEYAKRFPPAAGTLASTDPKIGTAYYMPTEILQQAYIYKPHDDAMYNSHESGEMEPIVEFEQIVLAVASKRITRTLPEHILHNFQHDLESLWWILLRVLTDFIPNPVANAWARQLFDNSIGQTSGPRFDAFHFGVTKLRTVLPPHLRSTFAFLMEYLRVEMRRHYIVCQKRGNVYCQFSYVPVHVLFRNALTVLSRHRREEWAHTSLGRDGLAEVEPLRARKKRKRPSDDEHSDYQPGARITSRSNLSKSGRQPGQAKRSTSGV